MREFIIEHCSNLSHADIDTPESVTANMIESVRNCVKNDFLIQIEYSLLDSQFPSRLYHRNTGKF